MTENRTPIQISGNRVLCADGTLWRWDDENDCWDEIISYLHQEMVNLKSN
jgi:hypothetical protein